MNNNKEKNKNNKQYGKKWNKYLKLMKDNKLIKNNKQIKLYRPQIMNKLKLKNYYNRFR